MAEIREEGPVKYTYHGIPNFRSYSDWELYINRGWRPAALLAVKDAKFLFEYELGFKSYFVEIGLDVGGEFDWFSMNSVSRSLPEKWNLAEWLEE